MPDESAAKEDRVKFAPGVPQELAFTGPGEHMPDLGKTRFVCTDGRTLYADAQLTEKIWHLDAQPGETIFVCKHWRDGKPNRAEWVVGLSNDSEKIRAMFEASGAKFSKKSIPVEPDYPVPVDEPVNASPEGVDTGGIPPGTQRAADYVAEQKLLSMLRDFDPETRIKVLDGMKIEDRLRLSLKLEDLEKAERAEVEAECAAVAATAATTATPAEVEDTQSKPQQPVDIGTRIRVAARDEEVLRIRSEMAIPARITGPSGGKGRFRVPAEGAKAAPCNVAIRRILHFVNGAVKAEGLMFGDQAIQDLVSTVFISLSQQGLITMYTEDEDEQAAKIPAGGAL